MSGLDTTVSRAEVLNAADADTIKQFITHGWRCTIEVNKATARFRVQIMPSSA